MSPATARGTPVKNQTRPLGPCRRRPQLSRRDSRIAPAAPRRQTTVRPGDRPRRHTTRAPAPERTRRAGSRHRARLEARTRRRARCRLRAAHRRKAACPAVVTSRRTSPIPGRTAGNVPGTSDGIAMPALRPIVMSRPPARTYDANAVSPSRPMPRLASAGCHGARRVATVRSHPSTISFAAPSPTITTVHFGKRLAAHRRRRVRLPTTRPSSRRTSVRRPPRDRCPDLYTPRRVGSGWRATPPVFGHVCGARLVQRQRRGRQRVFRCAGQLGRTLDPHAERCRQVVELGPLRQERVPYEGRLGLRKRHDVVGLIGGAINEHVVLAQQPHQLRAIGAGLLGVRDGNEIVAARRCGGGSVGISQSRRKTWCRRRPLQQWRGRPAFSGRPDLPSAARRASGRSR